MNESATKFYRAADWGSAAQFTFIERVKPRAPEQGTSGCCHAEGDPCGGKLRGSPGKAKATRVVDELRRMRPGKAADLVEAKIGEMLSYYDYPPTHWIKPRTNNPMERIMGEISRRRRVVGALPDGESAVMLVGARLRHILGGQWITWKYMSMYWLDQQDMEAQFQFECCRPEKMCER